MSEFFGWLASFFNIVGNIALAKKNISGWILQIVACAAWTIYSLLIHSRPLFVINIIFAGINLYGFVKWRKER